MSEVIQSLWIGQLSPLEQSCMRSFVRQGHEFHLYAYQPLDDVPSRVVLKDAREIVEDQFKTEDFQNLANFSDFFRYALLAKRGGWWVDLDVYCLRPFEFPDEYVFSSQLVVERTNDEVNSGVIKANGPVMNWCLEELAKVDTRFCPWSALGPKITLEAVSRFGLQRFVKSHETFCPLNYFEAPANILEPGTANVQFGPQTFAIHLWNEEMKRAGKDKWASYQGSLYEKLLSA